MRITTDSFSFRHINKIQQTKIVKIMSKSPEQIVEEIKAVIGFQHSTEVVLAILAKVSQFYTSELAELKRNAQVYTAVYDKNKDLLIIIDEITNQEDHLEFILKRNTYLQENNLTDDDIIIIDYGNSYDTEHPTYIYPNISLVTFGLLARHLLKTLFDKEFTMKTMLNSVAIDPSLVNVDRDLADIDTYKNLEYLKRCVREMSILPVENAREDGIYNFPVGIEGHPCPMLEDSTFNMASYLIEQRIGPSILELRHGEKITMMFQVGDHEEEDEIHAPFRFDTNTKVVN